MRAALVRASDAIGDITTAKGEAEEQGRLLKNLDAVILTLRRIMTAAIRLQWFTAGYGWVTVVAPIVIASPVYFAGDITFGGLMMAAAAFTQVHSSLRWFVDNIGAIADWRATLLRVASFRLALIRLGGGVAPTASCRPPLRLGPLDLATSPPIDGGEEMLIANLAAASTSRAGEVRRAWLVRASSPPSIGGEVACESKPEWGSIPVPSRHHPRQRRVTHRAAGRVGVNGIWFSDSLREEQRAQILRGRCAAGNRACPSSARPSAASAPCRLRRQRVAGQHGRDLVRQRHEAVERLHAFGAEVDVGFFVAAHIVCSLFRDMRDRSRASFFRSRGVGSGAWQRRRLLLLY